MCPLPNPIPTNKPNVEPKRPPRLGFCHFETLLQTKGSVLCLRMTVKSTKIDILKCFVQANQHHPTVQVVSNLGQHGQCQVGSWLRWDLNYVTWLRGAWQFDMIFSGKGWVVGIWLVEKLSSEQVIIILWEYSKSDCPNIHCLLAGQFPWCHPETSVFQLLERLTLKGKRQPEFTRELIKKKLTDDEDGIATTNLKVDN